MKRLRLPPAALALFGVAALLRVAYLLQNRSNPFFAHPIIDGWEYLARARAILADGILWDQVPIHAPLYPTLLAGLFAVVGENFTVLYAIQHGLGLATLFLVSRIARDGFGPGAGLLALALGALSWVPIYYEGQVLSEPLVAFLLAAATLLLLRSGAAGTDTSRGPGPRRAGRRGDVLAAAAGLVLGLAVITRANVLPLLPVAAGWLAVTAGRSKRRRAVWLLAAAAIVILPVTLQNYRASGSLVLVQANGGFNFYLANRPEAQAAHSLRPGVAWRRLAREGERAFPDDDAARDRYWRDRGRAFLTQHPTRVASWMVQRLTLFTTDAEVGTSQDPQWHRAQFPALRWAPLGAGWAMAATLFGLALWLRRRTVSRNGVLLALLGVTYVAALLFFPYFSRYRYPGLVLIWTFGGAGIAAGALLWRSAAPTARAGLLAGAAALLAFTLLDPFRLTPPPLVRIEYQLGRVAGQRGDAAAAVAHYRNALAESPADPDVLNNLGLMLDLTGQPNEAREFLADALRIAPDHVEARMNLAALDREAGRAEEALRGYERAVQDDPRKFDAVNALAALYLEQGRGDDALRLFRQASALRPSDRGAADQLGRLLLQSGQWDEARAHFERMAARNSTRAPGLVGLARLEAQAGRFDRAESLAREAAATEPDLAEAQTLLEQIRAHRAQAR